MVRTDNISKRFGFTMIELIFAIVIIAISVMSLPMMTQVTNKGIEGGLVQEAIFAGAAELMGASSGYWDERSLEDINVSSLSRVIDISADCNATTRLRKGHIAQPYHRRCLDSNSSANLDSKADNTIDALDDMEKTDIDTLLLMDPSSAGYKNKYTTTVDVNRTDNIKTLTVTIKDKDSNSTITSLKMQSANIGEIDYYKRTF